MDNETHDLAMSLANGRCMCTPDCQKYATEVHHKLPQSKINRARFPLFIDSIYNLIPVSHNCHMSKPLPRITPERADKYERYLEKLTRGELC